MMPARASAQLPVFNQHTNCKEPSLQKQRPATRAQPLVTICIAALNAAGSIRATLGSIKAIKTPDVEVIVIDGGSRDETIDICRELSATIDILISEKDRGIYDAMNKAWARASGQYVYYMGADDTIVSIPSEKLQRAIGETADGVCGRVELDTGVLHTPSYDFRLRYRNTLHHQGLFLRRGLFAEGPFNTRFRRFADFDLNQRLLRAGAKIILIPDVVCRFCTAGVSSRGESALPEMQQIISQNWGSQYVIAAFIWLRLRGIRARISQAIRT